MGTDREHPYDAAQRHFLRAELRRKFVNMRAGKNPGGLKVVGDQLGFPQSVMHALAPHEQELVLVMGAGLSSRGAVLVGRSAAVLHGMWVLACDQAGVEVTIPSRGASPSRSGVIFRHVRLRAWQITEIEGIRVTSAVRAFVDIARYRGFAEGLIAIDWLRYRGVELGDIAAEIRAMGRFKGIGIVRLCYEHSCSLSDSPYESYARALLIEHGITGIEVQVEVGGYRVDILLDGWLVIEIDGRSKYRGGDGERERQREFERQKAIANKGYVFLRYSPAMLLQNRAGFVAEVRATLSAGRPFRSGGDG